MPLPNDPAYQDWAWFPHGNGNEFKFSKCMENLEPLRHELTVLSGFSHIAAEMCRHNNADQFLTAAPTGDGDRDYANTISLDQVYASHIGDQTRFSSLVMSTDGGTGTARGTHTISFDKNGRPIPAEHPPKQIFDMLFVKADAQSAKRLELSRSALDEVLLDAAALKQNLSIEDRKNLDEYMESVRQAELKVEKAKKWLDAPLPNVEREPLNLELTTDEPREYLQTMFEMIYLAFRTDSTRIATYQIGRETESVEVTTYREPSASTWLNQLSHETKNPDGWKNFGIYCRFLNEEYGRFVEKLRNTPEPTEWLHVR